MLANSRLSGCATCVRLARMRTRATISGSELLLSVIAIRLAVLVVGGWSLTLLPHRVRDSEATCLSAARTATQSAATASSSRVDAAFDDMRLHD